MKGPKLTVDQVKYYLGTGLRVGHPWGGDKTWELHYDTEIDHDNRCSVNYVLTEHAKLICYRLSDLDNFIPAMDFVPMDKLSEEFDMNTVEHCLISANLNNPEFITRIVSFQVMQKILSWHFWIFGDGYFEHGLVVDRLKINE
jgi:hypothetical protein